MRSAATMPRWVAGRQWVGVNVRTKYVSLRGPSHTPLFSERNRIKCRVLPVGFGWRVVIRARGGPLGT